MVQSTVLNEVDLSCPVPPLRSEDSVVTYPNPVRLSQQKVESIIDILDTDVSADVLPEYIPNSPIVLTDAHKNSTEKLAHVLSITDYRDVSSPPLYTESKPMFLPTPTTLCVGCKEKSRYFGAISDIRNWYSLLFQLISFVIAVAGIATVSTLFTLSIGLFILFPIGPVIAWASFVFIRMLGTWELLSLPLTNTSSELCINCSQSPPPTYTSPELSYGTSKKSFFSKMVTPLCSAYSWRCIGYFMLVKPVVSVTSFAIALTSLVTGILVFPLLPATLRFIRILSTMQKNVAIAVLSPKDN